MTTTITVSHHPASPAHGIAEQLGPRRWRCTCGHESRAWTKMGAAIKIAEHVDAALRDEAQRLHWDNQLALSRAIVRDREALDFNRRQQQRAKADAYEQRREAAARRAIAAALDCRLGEVPESVVRSLAAPRTATAHALADAVIHSNRIINGGPFPGITLRGPSQGLSRAEAA
jgi:predicted ATPase